MCLICVTKIYLKYRYLFSEITFLEKLLAFSKLAIAKFDLWMDVPVVLYLVYSQMGAYLITAFEFI